MPLVDREKLNRWGFRRAVYASLMRLVRPWFFLCRITTRPIDPDIVVADHYDGIVMRQASRDDLLAAIEAYPAQLSLEFVDAAEVRGDFCVGAFDGPRMVAWAWASSSTAPHGDGLCVKVDAPYSYSYKWFTHPEYRGNGLVPQISLLRDKISAENGCTDVVAFTETSNYSSRQSAIRLGARLVGYAGYFTVFGKSYPFRTLGVVKHTFRFVRA